MKLSPSRLSTLRTAADVGIRLSPLRPRTVKVKADELGAMVDELSRMRPLYEAAKECHDAPCSGEDECISSDSHGEHCPRAIAGAKLEMATRAAIEGDRS